jgi:hypothetical protein
VFQAASEEMYKAGAQQGGNNNPFTGPNNPFAGQDNPFAGFANDQPNGGKKPDEATDVDFEEVK